MSTFSVWKLLDRLSSMSSEWVLYPQLTQFTELKLCTSSSLELLNCLSSMSSEWILFQSSTDPVSELKLSTSWIVPGLRAKIRTNWRCTRSVMTTCGRLGYARKRTSVALVVRDTLLLKTQEEQHPKYCIRKHIALFYCVYFWVQTTECQKRGWWTERDEGQGGGGDQSQYF